MESDEDGDSVGFPIVEFDDTGPAEAPEDVEIRTLLPVSNDEDAKL